MISSPLLTSKQYFKTLSTVHVALTTGQLLFAGIAIMLTAKGGIAIEPEELGNTLPLLAAGLSTGGVIAGHFLFRRKLQALRQLNGLSTKLKNYRAASLMRWALLEGPALFTIVAFLLTGKYWLLGLCAALIALFISYKPPKQSALQDLQLSHEEEYQLTDPEANLA